MSFNSKYPYGKTLFPLGKPFGSDEIIHLLIKARAELGELNGYTSSISKLTLFSSIFILQSLASSETENVNTTFTNVLRNQLLPKGKQDKECREVLVYRDTSISAFRNLKKGTISNQMICDIQSTLLPEKQHGYRTDLGQKVYSPPTAIKVPALMDDFEKFTRQKNIHIDPLIKSILAHYQLLAIHPFSDGNGRVARILMILLLVQEEILSFPIIYMSGYIYKNRKEFYRKLLDVTMYGKWNEYVIFMLKGFYLQAKETKELLTKIMRSFTWLNEVLKTNYKKIYSAELVEALYSYPIISPVKLAHELGVHYTTASRYLYQLSNAGILAEKKYGKYHLFTNKELIKIINSSS